LQRYAAYVWELYVSGIELCCRAAQQLSLLRGPHGLQRAYTCSGEKAHAAGLAAYLHERNWLLLRPVLCCVSCDMQVLLVLPVLLVT
jgi:hypothetical protein